MQEDRQPVVRTFTTTRRCKYTTRSGEVHHYASPRKQTYTYKLHYPDDAEMAQIRAELAAGHTKKEVVKRHHLGASYFRLNRLLEKHGAQSKTTEVGQDNN